VVRLPTDREIDANGCWVFAAPQKNCRTEWRIKSPSSLIQTNQDNVLYGQIEALLEMELSLSLGEAENYMAMTINSPDEN
jgi:hypothetical protein